MNGETYTLGNEGRRNKAYPDQFGRATIGIGHTGPEVHLGLTWTDQQVDDTFAVDYQKACNEASTAVGSACWIKLDPVRAAVVVDMAYQLGLSGLEKFVHFINAVQRFDWETAARHLRESLLAQQTPERVEQNAKLLETGAWPS